MEKKATFIVLMNLFLETLWKNHIFLIQVSKVRIKIYNTGDFQDLRLSATKMAAVSISCKIWNQHFFYYCFDETFAKKFMKKLSLFNTSFRHLCQDLVICQVSQSQTYCYWNGVPFNLARNLEKKSSFLMFWQSFCSKIYEKTAFF